MDELIIPLNPKEKRYSRQNILEDLGWNIYRIWSTDWWLDPKKELRKVDRYIQKLI